MAYTVSGSYMALPRMQLIVLGAIQIFIGICCIIFNSVAINYFPKQDYHIVGFGIWGGALFLINGALLLGASKNPKRVLVVGFIVLSLLCLAASIVTIVLAIITSRDFHAFVKSCDLHPTCDAHKLKVTLAMNALIAGLAILELIIATWCTVISLMALGIVGYPERVTSPGARYTTSHQVTTTTITH